VIRVRVEDGAPTAYEDRVDLGLLLRGRLDVVTCPDTDTGLLLGLHAGLLEGLEDLSDPVLLVHLRLCGDDHEGGYVEPGVCGMLPDFRRAQRRAC
jgi:hypothetical protein